MIKCQNRVGSSQWEVVQMVEGITIIPTPLSEGVIESFQSIFMFPDALQQLKLFYMEFCNYKKKFIKIRIQSSGTLSKSLEGKTGC